MNPIFDGADSSMLKNTVESIRYRSVVKLFDILNKFISCLPEGDLLMIADVPGQIGIPSTWLLIDFSLQDVQKLSDHLPFCYFGAYQSIALVSIAQPDFYFCLFVYADLLLVDAKVAHVIGELDVSI